MKNAFFLALVVFAFSTDAADRVTTDLDATIKIKYVKLLDLSDGGCAVEAEAQITRSDGGVFLEDTKSPTDVAGANRTTCRDILDNKAPALFRQVNGF